MRKKLIVVGAVIMALLFSIPQVRAAEFMAPGPDDNGNVTVGGNQTHHNLYVAGANTTVTGDVTGDLYAVGGNVTVEGDVEQDLTAAGGTLFVNGRVGGDLRIAGGNITVNGQIGGDVLIGAGNVTLSDASAVGGDLVVSGGTVTVNAPVTGSIRVSSAGIVINNKVGGRVQAKGDKLVFGSMADVAGAVTYTGLREAVVQDGAKVSNIEFKKMEGRKEGAGKAFAGILTVGFLIRLLAMIAAGLLLLKFFRERTATLVESIYQKPWSSLGIGLVAFIVVPIICILLLVVFIGYFIAAIIFVWYVLMIMIAMLMGAIFLGAWIVKLLTKKKQLVFDWQAVVIGVVVLSIVGLIPVVGWILCAIVFLMAFGALINMGRQKIQGEQNMAIISE